MTNIEKILNLHPCHDARLWMLENSNKSTHLLWRTCERGDWLLWLAAKLQIDRKLIVLAACDCAETALVFVPDEETRPCDAIQAARAWCGDKATLRQVERAADAAADAARAAAHAAHADADDAADAAARAARAAAHAAYAADAADAAAARAAHAAYDAAAAAYDAAADADAADAYAAAYRRSLADSATRVRKRIPWKIWKAALEDLQPEDE